ncbi:SDR family NAD(P)-dependent oxidoreductase [Yinghuangia aomiensis]
MRRDRRRAGRVRSGGCRSPGSGGVGRGGAQRDEPPVEASSVDLEHASVELWNEHASVASVASYTLAKAAHPYPKETAGSYLVLTSPAGMQGSANLSFYAAAKGGQRGFIKSLAREWGPDGIRVNGLAPLAVTPALDNAMRLDPTMEPRITALIPMGWIGDTETDIGPCAVFLCAAASRYVTGQTLVVSGGRMTAL